MFSVGRAPEDGALFGMATWKTSGDTAGKSADDETDILAALRANDVKRGFKLMMDRYGNDVYRFAHVMTRSPHLAEEVRQQVFVEVYRDLASFEGQSLRRWILGIARHRCLDATKKQRRWVNRFKNDPPPDEDAEDSELERKIDRGKLAKLLEICLGKLAPAARDAVVLRYHRDLSYDEASAIAGDNAGTMQQRVARALPALRRCLDARLQGAGR